MTYSIHHLRDLRRTIGRNIHALRAARRLSLKKLALRAKVDAERLDRYECGRDAIDLDSLFRIGCALDATVADLMESP